MAIWPDFCGFKFATHCYGPAVTLSSYERADSPYVRIQFAEKNRPKRYFKTAIRKDDPDKAIKVAKAINQVEAQLLNAAPKQTAQSWNWVANYIRQRYAAKERTRAIYSIRWDALLGYMIAANIPGPGALDRPAVFAYIDWRRNQTKEKSKRHPGLNTALDEVKLLGLIMDEAITRGLALSNPARKLGIEREETELKPEFTDTEIRAIYTALRACPTWMQRSFHIALQTGLRFSDTAIERPRVSLTNNHIVIEKPKGGRKRAFGIEIYPEIADMIRDFMSGRAKRLWEMPEKERGLNGLIWRRFFDDLGFHHLCFHCTRVTFITRGARAGVPEAAMMQMVNHASKEVHRIYQRLAAPDSLRLRRQFPIPTDADAK